jgi:hypothetical protein
LFWTISIGLIWNRTRKGYAYLVELLQVLDGHEGEFLVELLGSVDIHGVGENAERHPGSRNMGKSDGTRESLVTLGVVVLETDLEFDGLNKVPLLSTGLLVGLQGRLGEEGLDGASHA